jgi:hypothetical protein
VFPHPDAETAEGAPGSPLSEIEIPNSDLPLIQNSEFELPHSEEPRPEVAKMASLIDKIVEIENALTTLLNGVE